MSASEKRFEAIKDSANQRDHPVTFELLRKFPPGSWTEDQLEELWEALVNVAEVAHAYQRGGLREPLLRAWHDLDSALTELERAVERQG
jgi:hypothetical protein